MSRIGKNLVSYCAKRRAIIITSAIAFLVCYGMLIFNKVSLHDDMAHLFSLGGTYTSGRWSLGLIEDLFNIIIGNRVWSLPSIGGFFVFVNICLADCILCDFFGLKKTGFQILFTVIFVSSPALICMMGYLFTAPEYALGVLTAVLSGVLLGRAIQGKGNLSKVSRLLQVTAGILSGAFSMGIYQSYVSFTAAVLLVAVIAHTANLPFC